MAAAGIEMEVVNFCAISNGGCDHKCQHSREGAICSCRKGYMLMADRKGCRGTLLLMVVGQHTAESNCFVNCIAAFYFYDYSVCVLAVRDTELAEVCNVNVREETASQCVLGQLCFADYLPWRVLALRFQCPH